MKIKRGMDRATVIFLMLVLTIFVILILKINTVCKETAERLLGSSKQPVVISNIAEEQAEASELISLGMFKVTHYCICKECSPFGITKTGTVLAVGRTISVDPKVIPLGSMVVIDDYKYVAEDIGGWIRGNRIDMFVGSHAEALELGVRMTEVFSIK